MAGILQKSNIDRGSEGDEDYNYMLGMETGSEKISTVASSSNKHTMVNKLNMYAN